MLLSKQEVNILLTAGFYKAVPTTLLPDLGGDSLKSLLQMKLLKTNRSKTACRLTSHAIEMLANAGYKFHHDKHPIGDGDLLTRRLQSAEIALGLQQIGVDVFLKELPQFCDANNYISAYAMRKSFHTNVLGMAKFSGYYFTQNMTYIVYHLGTKLSGFYPTTEYDTIRRHMTMIGSDEKYLFMGGNDYTQMSDLYHRQKEPTLKNDYSFLNAVGVFNQFCEVGILPLNSMGLRILRIMSVPSYREKIAMGVNGAKPSGGVAEGVRDSGEYIQVNLDNNIQRLRKITKCADKTIVIAPEESLFWNPASKKTDVWSVSLDTFENILELKPLQDLSRIPFIDKNGNGIHYERSVYD